MKVVYSVPRTARASFHIAFRGPLDWTDIALALSTGSIGHKATRFNRTLTYIIMKHDGHEDINVIAKAACRTFGATGL
jgi:hypothetical protein